jgi:hypothetical protein
MEVWSQTNVAALYDRAKTDEGAPRPYRTAIASIMAIPTGATRVRLKAAPQRRQVLALA